MNMLYVDHSLPECLKKNINIFNSSSLRLMCLFLCFCVSQILILLKVSPEYMKKCFHMFQRMTKIAVFSVLVVILM